MEFHAYNILVWYNIWGLISTHGNFENNTGELLPGHNSIDYNATNMPGH